MTPSSSCRFEPATSPRGSAPRLKEAPGIGRAAPHALSNPVQPEQNTKLYRSYLHEPGFSVGRPRGKSPQQSAFFTRSPALNNESSLLASLCCLLDVLPRTGAPVSPQALANISRGEKLCQAFEVYRELVQDPRVSFEHFVYLVSALAAGQELMLVNCEECSAVTVVDRMSLSARHCLHCAGGRD
jgi:hypothetical protein